ncbi:Nuclease sbcCD subunit D [Peptoniphilus harei]|uniref:metallophosphoesterase family protein n=1 Tax=Peptoniphilus harei TaxID=54005 RepID=UPI000F6FEF87|nr:DNA repair exonuclease [Peptoniphilus harei]QQE47273.1 DNA repair exonuclease [Peptoniphilus harei]VEJ34193.1 Nuclease sbcCD subunit D [Peptoniphilus harei]
MKIIHTGDLHLKKLYKGKLPLEVSNKLLEDAWRALFEVFEFSNEVEADIILIAGDLFEREYFNLRDLNRFLDLVRNVKAKIFIAFGNHDYLSEDNLFLKVDLPENLYIFKNNLDYFELSELKTRIYGISYDSYAFNRNFGDLDLDEEFINIGLFHSDLKDERYLPLSKDFLQKFNYVALGHIHKRAKVYDNTYYSGSLIPLSFKDEGKRGIIYLDDEKKSFEFKNFSKREFINLEIKLNKEMTFSDILGSIQENIYQDNLYRIRLRGETKHPEDLENFLRENLNAFYFEILNELYDIEEDFEIEDKYILEFLNSFGSSKTQMDAKELSKKYILEQYYDI